MTPEQFCYWFQGFAELNKEPPTAEQWKSIGEHLQTVFKKVTPPVAPNKETTGQEIYERIMDAMPLWPELPVRRRMPDEYILDASKLAYC